MTTEVDFWTRQLDYWTGLDHMHLPTLRSWLVVWVGLSVVTLSESVHGFNKILNVMCPIHWWQLLVHWYSHCSNMKQVSTLKHCIAEDLCMWRDFFSNNLS